MAPSPTSEEEGESEEPGEESAPAAENGESRYVSIQLPELTVGESLPVDVHLYLDFRFITYRAKGDSFDRHTFDRMEFKKIRYLFVRDRELASFTEWVAATRSRETAPPPPKELQGIAKARVDLNRRMLDIFQAKHPDRKIAAAIESSKAMVEEIMKAPFAVKTLAHLQSFSQGTVGHSVNTAILSTYLAFQLGYDSKVILQNIGMGALLHDIGKTKVPIQDGDDDQVIADKMLQHPQLGFDILSANPNVPNEVKLIVVQHHESHDGTGYPKKLRGPAIYDLTKIVAIANAFDQLVGEGQGSLVERQRKALNQLDQALYRKFDPQKLDKCLRVLKLGV